MPTVADEQILRGSAATITASFRDQYGDPAAPTGTVTVAVSAADGSTVVAAGSSTTTSAGSTTSRQRALTAAQTASLGVLSATWSDGAGVTVSTTVEIVGGFYASVDTITGYDAALADDTRYGPVRIRRARALVEAEFEQHCGVAFVPRYARERLSGTGTTRLPLPDPELRTVRSVRIYSGDGSYTTLGQAALAAIPANREGCAVRTDGGVWIAGQQNIVIEYEHGYDLPPADVVGAFITRIRDVLNRERSGIPSRTQTFTSEAGGTYGLVVPGQRGSLTGIPDVDVVLMAHMHRTPGIA